MVDMFLDETYDLLMCHVSQRDCFGPLGKIICSDQDESVTFRQPRMYFSNKIKSLAPKRPRLHNQVLDTGGCQLQIPEPLTCIASLLVLNTITHHSRPI
jgi:hypothetical protein